MKPRILLISALGSAIVIAANVATASYLNFYYWAGSRFERWQWFVAKILDLHRTQVASFARRPITTFAIDLILPSLGPWWAFVLVQFAFLAAAAYALEKWEAILAFFLSFTVLFSFITPNDSYDEAAQYFFLFLALRNRGMLFSLFFFLALLTRETSLILLPGFALLQQNKRAIPYLLAPVALYLLSLYWLGIGDDPNRFLYWAKNFQNLNTTYETAVSLFLALALPMLLSEPEKNWPFLLSAALNFPIVCLTAYARETRLFALPLVFLWPSCTFKNLRLRRWLLPLAAAAAIGLSYHPAYRSAGPYRACAVIFALLFAFKGRSSRESPSPG